MDTLFGRIEVPKVLAGQFSARSAGVDEGVDLTLLDLSDCQLELTFVSPGMARRALVEGERLDPRLADQLVRGFTMLMPAILIWGERGRLLAAAPMLRRVRGALL